MIRRPPTSSSGGPTGRVHPRPPRPRALSLRDKLTWALAFAVLGVALVWILWPVVSLLLGSVALAWLLLPAVHHLERRGVRSRPAAVGLLFGGGVLAAALLALLVIPAVSSEVEELSGNVAGYIDHAIAEIGPAAAWLEEKTHTKIPVDLSEIQAQVPGWISRLSPDARQSIQNVFSRVASSGLGVVSSLLDLVLLPLFAFYLLNEWERLGRNLKQLVPPRHRHTLFRLGAEINARLAAFVRGQITVCVILGSLYSVGLWLAGIDLAFVVGMTAGALFIIPYLGPTVGIAMALSLSLLKYGVDAHLLKVAIAFGLVQALESWVLTPRIVGHKVGLHPMVVMVALIAGGSMLGLRGLMFAIPATATLDVLFTEGLAIYRRSNFFQGAA